MAKDEGSGGGPPAPPSWRAYAGMGTELAGAICGLTLLGLWIDHSYGTGRKATLIGAAIGVIGGTYNFIRQAINLSKDTERQQRERKRGEHNDTRP